MIKDFNKIAIICGERRVSYKELRRRIAHFAAQFPAATPQEADEPVQNRRKVMILSENREGFIYAFFSVWLNRCIAVPVDAASSVEDLLYIIKDCAPECVWTTASKVAVVKEAYAQAGKDAQIGIIDDFELAALPECAPEAEIDYEAEHTALIIYTSGTTGNPKGVMLSFKNLLTNIRSVSEEVRVFTSDRRSIVLLPLHHVFPLQGSMIAPILLGGGVAISPSLTATDIMKTLSEGKVKIFIGVPRLWQTLYEGIMKKINAKALTRGLYRLCEKVNSVKFSRIVFRKIHKMMGGGLEACPSGGAALDPAIWNGMHTLGIELMDGYGMTECAPIITFSRYGDMRSGCVGKALPSCEVAIINGEICARGDNIMQGYYNRPEETAEVIDSEGWLHSGDLGYLDGEGRLYITGKKKEIIVLSNGKNINPSELESIIESDKERVKEAAVVEENNTLKAIVIPHPSWAAGKSLKEMEEALKREVIDVFNRKVASYKKLFGLYVYQGELPRTRLEKIQRFKLKSIVERLRKDKETERTEAVPEYDHDTEEYRLLVDYLRKEKKVDARPTDNLVTDLGFDSLDMVGMEVFINSTFGMKVSQAELQSVQTVAELSALITAGKTRVQAGEIEWKSLLSQNLNDYKVPQMDKSGWRIVKMTGRFFRRRFSLKLDGMQNIPQESQFIMVANHQCLVDGLLLFQGLSREQFERLRVLAKGEHVRDPFTKYLARHHGVIVLDRKNVKESIMRLGKALQNGNNLLIFPEGTRTEDGRVNAFRPTFAILSRALGVPVLPVCIKGAFEAMPKHKKIPAKKPVSITFLPLVHPEAFKDEYELTDRVRADIENCLDR